ncbi:MAG TPA: gamma-glutamyltransferase [Bryobacteraceae bacterium]|nr:gamma-glutamyltransferase [Bryobacteraceae bacterium]
MVISRHGIVATSQTLASQAGAQVLARGGTAMDAAIAANAALGVVEPMSNGVGGDLFAIYWEAKTGRLTGINASGWAPAAMSLEALKSKGHNKVPEEGIHSVTVPGCTAGWEKLHRKFGRLSWAELFRPAIYYAEEGFPVTEIIQGHWRASTSKLGSDQGARRLFLKDGMAPAVGDVFRNADLAKTLRLIAGGGAAAFYKGPIAKAMLATSDKLGGTLASADFSEFEAEWVEPISTEYRGWKIYELPPNGQGVAALEMLNIMEAFPLFQYRAQAPEALHAKIEAQKLAYSDLQRYIADPRFAKIPLDGLLSKEYGRERASLVDPMTARCQVSPGAPPRPGGDTIYLSVVDRDGNIASLIQSLYLSFGSGVLVEGMGFHLQNRGALFEMDPEHPNAVAPRKRPLHTIIPAFMEKDNIHIGFGIMGGYNQAQAHAQFVSNLVDHNMNIQGGLEAARFTKLSFGGCDVMIENRIPEEVREALTRKGHRLDVLGDYSSVMGGGQAVLHDSKARVNYGASSPRKDGAAVPESPPYFQAPAVRRKK